MRAVPNIDMAAQLTGQTYRELVRPPGNKAHTRQETVSNKQVTQTVSDEGVTQDKSQSPSNKSHEAGASVKILVATRLQLLNI